MGYIVEALSVSDVVDDNDAIGIAIVAVGDGPKSLLSGSVPLSELNVTNTSLAFSPLTFTILVFWVRGYVRSRLRLC